MIHYIHKTWKFSKSDSPRLKRREVQDPRTVLPLPRAILHSWALSKFFSKWNERTARFFKLWLSFQKNNKFLPAWQVWIAYTCLWWFHTCWYSWRCRNGWIHAANRQLLSGDWPPPLSVTTSPCWPALRSICGVEKK